MGSETLAGPSLPRNTRSRFGSGSRTARRPWLVLWRLGITGPVLLALGYGLMLLHEAGQSNRPKSRPAAPSPAWAEIPSPRQIFRLEGPEFAGEVKYYEARQHRTGGGRQDVFGFGGSDENAPLLRLIIYRPGQESPPDSSFFVDLARRAAETGLAIARATQPAAVVTRFGAFEAADLTLARDSGSGRECLGFRFANPTPDLRITGFACGVLAAKSALACLIDRIGLATIVEDGDLIAFFGARPSSGVSACNALNLAPAPARSGKS